MKKTKLEHENQILRDKLELKSLVIGELRAEVIDLKLTIARMKSERGKLEDGSDGEIR